MKCVPSKYFHLNSCVFQLSANFLPLFASVLLIASLTSDFSAVWWNAITARVLSASKRCVLLPWGRWWIGFAQLVHSEPQWGEVKHTVHIHPFIKISPRGVQGVLRPY